MQTETVKNHRPGRSNASGMIDGHTHLYVCACARNQVCWHFVGNIMHIIIFTSLIGTCVCTCRNLIFFCSPCKFLKLLIHDSVSWKLISSHAAILSLINTNRKLMLFIINNFRLFTALIDFLIRKIRNCCTAQ